MKLKGQMRSGVRTLRTWAVYDEAYLEAVNFCATKKAAAGVAKSFHVAHGRRCRLVLMRGMYPKGSKA